jgi:large subunit ribosomal protein L1
LPHGIGKQRRVIVFAEGEDAEKAKQAGADEVGGDELISRISQGYLEFDIAIAVPYMMRKVGKLGRILGPKGKMPSPKTGTVTEDVQSAVKEFKAGRIEFRADSGGNVHVPVGKLSFSVQALKENLETFLEYLKSVRPSAAKGAYIKGVYLSASMSPSVAIAYS